MCKKSKKLARILLKVEVRLDEKLTLLIEVETNGCLLLFQLPER